VKVRFFDIEWDTGDEDLDEDPSPSECGLPSECVVEVEDDLDLDEEGADALSERYGFCVSRCSFEVIG
jgi:hypothetical protein